MRMLAIICFLSLLVAGCVSSRTREDSFISLHDHVKQMLGSSCDCGPIITNGVDGGRYFEVNPQKSEVVDGRLIVYAHPRGLQITVAERQFVSQKEWDRRYTSGTNLMAQFMEMVRTNGPVDTNRPIDAKTAQRIMGVTMGITNWFGLADLPDWRYQNTGVDVSVQEVEVAYPGLDHDEAEAQKRYMDIVTLLQPYHRPNNSLEPTPTAP